MKEFDIRLPPRLTECKVLICSLPYYSGLTVIDGFIIDSTVDGYTLQKVFRVQSGLVLTSEVEGTFKLVHEVAQSGLVLDSHIDIEALYKIIPEPSSIVLLEEPARLFAEGFLRVSDGIELDSSLLDIQVSRSLGRGESGFIINSSVDGTLKVSHISDIQSGFMLKSEAEFVPRILARPTQSGIVISAAPIRGILQKMTKGESSIIFKSEADAILSHSLGRMESGFVINSNNPPMYKHSFFDGTSTVKASPPHFWHLAGRALTRRIPMSWKWKVLAQNRTARLVWHNLLLLRSGKWRERHSCVWSDKRMGSYISRQTVKCPISTFR